MERIAFKVTKPSDAENGIFRENFVITMAVDVQVPCVNGSSAAMTFSR